MKPQTDFALHRTPDRLLKYQMAMALAYSTRLNFRRLESHTHGFWGLVSEDLVGSKSERVLSIAQYTVSMRRGDASNQNPEHSTNSVKGKPYAQRIPDFIGVWIGRALRVDATPFLLNTTQEERPFPSDPEAKSDIKEWCMHAPHGYVPMSLPSTSPPSSYPSTSTSQINGQPPFWSDILNWSTSRISTYSTLFHIELKRPPSRHIEDPQIFFENLHSAFAGAIKSAQQQWKLILASQPSITRLITIMGVGEWWSFQILQRNCEGQELFPTPTQDGQDYRFLDMKSISTSAAEKPRSRKLPSHLPVPESFRLYDNPAPNSLETEQRGKAAVLFDQIVLTNEKDDSLEEETPLGDDIEYEEEDVMPDDSPDDDNKSTSGEESDSPPGDNIKVQPRQNRNSASQNTSPRASAHRYLRHCNPDLEEQPVCTLRQALPLSHNPSKFMLYGTPASNQRLYLVQELLKREVAILEARHKDFIV
ncbi:hypothetical protein CVT24_013077 [Panaeolus cyanescens]|uniref:Uncharacterized protein n=1 Tax=Panaeolus cyanescens TaxID=181874 RepID=A0A409VVH6_9AGAR|nr:hypothetical protein CVT24_013077 [Panaeolus cyanescens]